MPRSQERTDEATDETEHLLPQSASSEERQLDVTRSEAPSQLLRQAVVWVLSIQFLSALPYYLLTAPRLKLLESLVCRSYYLQHDPKVITEPTGWPGFRVEEALCKESGVQQELSDLRSWAVFLEALCVLLLSIPYGIAADWYGKKLVFTLSMLGLGLSNVWFVCVCTFYKAFQPSSTLWSNAFLVLGCGSYMAFGMTTALAMDVATDADRSIVLYWTLCANILAYTAGSMVATATMQTAWAPFLLALVVSVLSVLLVLTPRFPPHADAAAQPSGSIRQSSKSTPRAEHLAAIMAGISEKVTAIKRNHCLLMLLLHFFPMASRGPLSELALVYASRRYGWTLRWTASLDTMNGIIGLVTNAIFVPRIISVLETRGNSPWSASKTVAQYSAAAICLGCIAIGLAAYDWIMIPGWVLYSTGSGIRMSVISMGTFLVSPQEFAIFSSLMITVETVADLTISPLIWRVWSIALQWHQTNLGLPWFVTAVAYAVMMLMLSLTPWKKWAEEWRAHVS